jgi:hypothetical protein
MKRLSRLQSQSEKDAWIPLNRTPEPEAESEEEPRLRRLTWEPSTWIRPPTKAQLMAGR